MHRIIDCEFNSFEFTTLMLKTPRVVENSKASEITSDFLRIGGSETGSTQPRENN
jgi:hypothetical protein